MLFPEGGDGDNVSCIGVIGCNNTARDQARWCRQHRVHHQRINFGALGGVGFWMIEEEASHVQHVGTEIGLPWGLQEYLDRDNTGDHMQIVGGEPDFCLVSHDPNVDAHAHLVGAEPEALLKAEDDRLYEVEMVTLLSLPQPIVF
jgi:hypothetical protein